MSASSSACLSPDERNLPGIVLSYTDDDVFSFGSLEIRMLMGFANGLSALCDVVIVVALCYYLHSKRTGFRKYVRVVWRVRLSAI